MLKSEQKGDIFMTKDPSTARQVVQKKLQRSHAVMRFRVKAYEGLSCGLPIREAQDQRVVLLSICRKI